MSTAFRIKDIRVFTIRAGTRAGDYFQQGATHWLVDTLISNPMSGYAKYRERRSSWGISALGSLVVILLWAQACAWSVIIGACWMVRFPGRGK